jgi:hypothetical protein
LIVDADAVLAGAIAVQRFEPIGRRHAQSDSTRAWFNMRNLRNATAWISPGSRRLREPDQISSVSGGAKLTITDWV